MGYVLRSNISGNHGDELMKRREGREGEGRKEDGEKNFLILRDTRVSLLVYRYLSTMEINPRIRASLPHARV